MIPIPAPSPAMTGLRPGGGSRQRAELRRPATSRPVMTRTLDRRDVRHEAMDTMAIRHRSTRCGARRSELDCAGHQAAQLDAHHRSGLDPGGRGRGLARNATPPTPVPARLGGVTTPLAAFVPATMNGELHTGWVPGQPRGPGHLYRPGPRPGRRRAGGCRCWRCWLRDAEPADRQRAGRGAGDGQEHVSHILSKLGAANRTQAVTRARALGLLR
jgi:hypothetical protein